MLNRLASALLLATLALLSGCASLNALDSEVSSYSRWPAGRQPATYAFERLPSQQANPQQAQVLEDAARRAIEAAGFVPAAEGAPADVAIQIGARITSFDRSPFYDPFWYGPRGPFHPPIFYGRYGRPHFGGGWGYGYWGPGYDLPYYDREVGVLIRDRRSGEQLYEGRARSDGSFSGSTQILAAMFSAALQDFPKGNAQNPHTVRTPMSPA
jgi:hypothetical protein